MVKEQISYKITIEKSAVSLLVTGSTYILEDKNHFVNRLLSATSSVTLITLAFSDIIRLVCDLLIKFIVPELN